jgi:hypothetical protein
MKMLSALTAVVLATSSATFVSGAATAAARPHITLAQPAVHTAGDGSTVRFHGTLSHTGGRNDKTVRLQRRHGGSWHTAAWLFHQDDGAYVFPRRTYAAAGTYTFRTVVGRSGHLLDVSPVRRLLVREPARDGTAVLQLRASDRVQVTGCKDYANITYTVGALSTTPWRLALTVTRPDGSVVHSVTRRGTGPVSAVRYTDRLCTPTSPTGTYGVRGVLTSSRFATLTETNSFALTTPTELLPDLRIKNLGSCSAAERTKSQANGGTGCFYIDRSSGTKLLKFPAVTGNVGDGALEVRSTRTDPGTGTASWSGPAMQRIYTDSDGDGVADGHEDVPSAATFYWEQLPSGTDDHGHTHWHIKDFDDYSIVGHTDAVDEKHGFCLQDNTTVGSGGPSQAVYPEQTSCGYQEPNATSIVHGLSVGWGDTYPSSLQDQGIDVSSLPDGTYTVKVTADAKNLVRERDESNNSVTATVTISGNNVTAVTATGGI